MTHLLLSAAFFLLSLLHRSTAVDLSLCNPFIGEWFSDDSYPLYPYSSCPLIDPEFNCQLYGRPDSGYLRYRWKPADCDLPPFDGLDFLARMRGRTVMFVGDSLGRNQWESLLCMLNTAAPSAAAVMLRGDPLSTYKFLEYEVSVSFYRAPYLVDIEVVNGERVLRLDDIGENGEAWKEADVLCFNSGHWWTHTGNLQGSMEWKDPISKNCYRETAPVNGWNYTSSSSSEGSMIQVIRGVLNSMRTPAYFSDITRLSELRKDGHPSIYSGNLNPQQRADPDHSSDCSHWCLPGLPDTWNQLFYAALFFS